MLTCAICGEGIVPNVHCQEAHEDLCHPCAVNVQGAYGYYDHADPSGSPPPPTLVLSPRDVEAILAYQRRVQRLPGSGS